MTLSRTALSAAATALAFALSGAPTAAAATLELNCTYEESAVTDGVATEITCDNQLYAHSESLIEPNSPEFWGYISICIGLVIGAGMMSGLTIGLVSLDANSLKVLTRSGTPAEKRRAARILPLVQRHHLLLVTLLLSNAICMEALPIFLDRLAPAVIAIVISVTAVLLFGEIIPQALCTRFGLAIGANLAYVVWFLIIVSFPISWPISKLLDYLFGHSHSTYFGREQLTELVQLHGTSAGRPAHGGPYEPDGVSAANERATLPRDCAAAPGVPHRPGTIASGRLPPVQKCTRTATRNR